MAGAAATEPSARAAAAAAVVGDKIVVVGGQANGKLVPQTEVFDGKRWTDVAEMPTPREHLGAASDGRYLYAVGGRNLSADKNSPALERYDPASDSWTKLEDMPTAAGSVGAAHLGGLLIAVGGEGTTSVSDAVQAYDIEKRAWSQLPALLDPPPRNRRQRPQRLPLRNRRRDNARARRIDRRGGRPRLRLTWGRRQSAGWVLPRLGPRTSVIAAHAGGGGQDATCGSTVLGGCDPL